MLNIEALYKNIEIIQNLDNLPDSDLAEFNNWGSFISYFASHAEEIKEKLEAIGVSTDTIQTIQESALTSYFTDEQLVRAIWNIITESVKIKENTKILDPCCGTGNFFRFMPEHIKQIASLTAIEKEPFSAKIAQKLLPTATVLNMPFEEFNCPMNYYQIAIGNLPFAQIEIKDHTYKNLEPKIYESFILKMKDLVCVGGLIIAIMPKGFLAKANSKIREYLAVALRPIYALQLPAEAFKKSAHTEIASDLVIYQKTDKSHEKNWDIITSKKYFLNSSDLNTLKEFQRYTQKRFPNLTPKPEYIPDKKEQEIVNISQYYIEKRPLTLGQLYIRKNRFNRPEIDITGTIEETVKVIQSIRLPISVRKLFESIEPSQEENESIIYFDVKPGKFYLINGQYVYRSKGCIKKVPADTAKAIEQMNNAVEIVKRIYEIYNTDLEFLTDIDVENLNKELKELQEKYQKFFYSTAIQWFRSEQKHGHHILNQDSNYYLIKSTYNSSKNELFELFTNWKLCKEIPTYSSIDEIYQKCLAIRNRLDLDWITEQAKKYLNAP